MISVSNSNNKANGKINTTSPPYITTPLPTQINLTPNQHNKHSTSLTKPIIDNNKENHKNQKNIKNKDKNANYNRNAPITIPITPPKFTTSTINLTINHTPNRHTTTPCTRNTPQRRWRNIGGNSLQRLLDAPSDDIQWQPSSELPIETHPSTEFAALLHSPLLNSIY